MIHPTATPVADLRAARDIGARLGTATHDAHFMQLPDEAIGYQYSRLMQPLVEEWTPAAELRRQHFLPPTRLRELMPRLMQVRSQIAAERDLKQVPVELEPLLAGFIDLPQKTLAEHRRLGEGSLLGRTLKLADQLRDHVDRVVILADGGLSLGSRALFEALRSSYHNELPAEKRLGTPRIYFAGDNLDNDALQDLLDLLQTVCVDPELSGERWGVAVISKSGDKLETAAAFRVFKSEAAEFYGRRSDIFSQYFVPITAERSKLRDLCQADGIAQDEMLDLPDDVGVPYSVFTPAGLLPAAVMGLDVRALLLGAAAMTSRFLDEPFERNPALQYAAVNFLLAQDKPLRVLSVWSKKLEALGVWYDQLVSGSLGKQGQGPTPLTEVQTRDLDSRGQQHREGPRDRVINNLIVKVSSNPPIVLGMAEHNQDDLNSYNRKSFAELMDATQRKASGEYYNSARPAADLVLPTLSEHTMGQLMQMLMLATVVEGRLMGINPYGRPANGTP